MGRGAGRAESRFAAARPGTAGVYTPRPRYGGQIAFWGLGGERQTGLCATQRNGGRLDNLALQNCLLPTEWVIRSIHKLRDISPWLRACYTSRCVTIFCPILGLSSVYIPWGMNVATFKR